MDKHPESKFDLPSGVQSWPPLDKHPEVLAKRRTGWYATLQVRLPPPLSFTTGAVKQVRIKPLAELGQAERSEASPREARQAAEGGQHFDVPELREGRQAKQGCDSTAATQLPRLNCPWSAGKRALHERDIYD